MKLSLSRVAGENLKSLKSLLTILITRNKIDFKGLIEGVKDSISNINGKLTLDIKQGSRNVLYGGSKTPIMPSINLNRSGLMNNDLANITTDSNYRDYSLELSMLNRRSLALTPEVMKVDKFYLRSVPQEIKQFYESKKQQERKELRELREKDHSNLKLLNKIKKQK